MPDQSTTPPIRPRLRRGAALLGAVAAVLAVTACGSSAASPTTTTSGAATPTTGAVSLAGATLNFADQFKEYQTIFTATGALKGAPYSVSYSEFVGGPPIIAAETGGSVDLGDMAETPTVFAQAAGDPVKVVAATVSADPKTSPYAILVPKGSPITKVADLRGKTIAVQEGTVEQYLLIQILKKADIPYSDVTIDNLSVTDASAAVTAGKVDAAVVSQPLTGLDLLGGKVTQLTSGAGYITNYGYLTASRAALDNPQKAAVIADFIHRFYQSLAVLRQHPGLAAATYVKTYGVPLAVAQEAAASVQAEGTPITAAVIAYQQQESDTFQRLGLIPQKLDAAQIFDLPFNRTVAASAGLSS